MPRTEALWTGLLVSSVALERRPRASPMRRLAYRSIAACGIWYNHARRFTLQSHPEGRWAGVEHEEERLHQFSIQVQSRRCATATAKSVTDSPPSSNTVYT